MEKIKNKNTAISKAIDVLVDSNADLSTMFKEEGILKQLTKGLIEKALQVELKNHLGYDKYQQNISGHNARNGTMPKKLITDNGVIEIETPRDRKGDFEPILVPKRQNRIEGLDQKIIYLYAKGMSITDIQHQLEEMYGARISTGLISQITDEVLEDVKLWQNRPLEKIYPIVFFDCLVVKTRQERCIINKSIYVALGINLSGKKDVLGLWINESEGSKFWLSNLTELKNRGVKDILIASTDNLKGMSEAIFAMFPKAEHQLCIVHQIRNSLKYVSHKNKKELAADLKGIYTAITEEEARWALEEFEKKWEGKYPHIAKSWYNNWGNLVPFLQYPVEIRRVIYTTNAIESLNSQFRKFTRNRRVFPNDQSVFKALYLAIDYIARKWTMPIANWHAAMAHFMVKFEQRIAGVE